MPPTSAPAAVPVDQPDDLWWDPFDAGLKADPHPVWRRLRDEAPVYYNAKFGFYALSRFADVERAHREPKLFSSAHGTVLELMQDEPSPPDSGMMIFLDPPEHTRLRRLASRAFTPRRVGELEGEIRRVCRDLLDAQVGRSRFDYVADFGARLPAYVIAALLGVPAEDRDEVRGHIDDVFHSEPDVGMVNDEAVRHMAWLHQYISGQIEARAAAPRDDMLSDLVQAEITEADGTTRRLTHNEAAAFGILLIGAGTETVARLIGWSGLLLDRHPDQRADLAAEPALVPNAVEELLRYEAPSPVQGRWTTEPVELHGVTVPVDSKVLLLTGSAGRDERAFPDPDRFDVHRRFDLHVSFGYGIHFCLGAALARMEGRIALEETLLRFPEWSVDLDAAEPLHTSTVRGYRRLPVEV